MRVSAIQFQPHFLDIQANLATVERLILSSNSDLIVLPELCLSGYYFSSHEQVKSIAEDESGATLSRLRDLSKQKQCALVVGFVERDGDALFNSCAFITPEGVQEIYRKTHLYGEEKIWFTPGNSGFIVIPYRDATIGMMICYDWRFPEAARSLVLNGAEIICHPSNLISPEAIWRSTMRTRSIENKVFTVTANRTGTEWKGNSSLTFTGCSQIVSYNGDVLAELNASEEGIITADIDMEKVRKKSFSRWNDIIADRRPELYVR